MIYWIYIDILNEIAINEKKMLDYNICEHIIKLHSFVTRIFWKKVKNIKCVEILIY